MPSILQSRRILSPDRDPHFASVSLLLDFDDTNGSTNFFDRSPYRHAITAAGNAQISTTQSKFGGGSAYLDGTGDMLYVDDTRNATNFGTGAFTLEFWIYPTAGPVSTYNPTFYSNTASGDWNTGSVGFRIHHQNALFGFNDVLTFSSAIQNHIWTHVAIVRIANTITAYLNGSSVGSITYSGSIGNSSTRPLIGASDSYPTGREFMTGYIEDFRITKGVARYVTNFSPPQRSFPRG